MRFSCSGFDRGYLQKGGDGSYSLIHLPGYHAIQAGRHGALKVFATPILEEAVHSSGETGILAAVDGHNIRFLRKCLPGQQIVCDPAIGATPRLEEDACGIAILMASVPAVIAR